MGRRISFAHRLRFLRNFLAQPARVRFILAEALACLIFARIALLLLPFRSLTRCFATPCKSRVMTDEEHRRLRKLVGWAVGRAARHLPGRTVCFPRGIAAQIMCRRRGICTTLYYGARSLPEQGLVAHVWVQDGDEGVVGYQEAGQYRVLARFPA